MSNLTIACRKCNTAKSDQPLEVFLADKPGVLAKLKRQLKTPLKDAAAVNATRWALYRVLGSTGSPVEIGTGGRTKFNRSRLGIPKTHALDAACTGVVDNLVNWQRPTLQIRCTGRGAYQRTRLTRFGFPRGYLMRRKQVHGFQTGDMVRAKVPDGCRAGVYLGRVAVRSTGSFNIQTLSGVIQGVSYHHCRLVQRADGYGYSQVVLPTLEIAIPPATAVAGFLAEDL